MEQMNTPRKFHPPRHLVPDSFWLGVSAEPVLLACALFDPRPARAVAGHLERSTPKPGTASLQAALEIDIDYTGSFYRQVFGYSPGAFNIKHLVLLVPADAERTAPADQIFQSLLFPSEGKDLEMRQDRQAYTWDLDYLNEAPSAS